MIEILSQERCIGCNQCVSVCPTNVFEKVNQEIPVIARQQDCQTCFMCELYCPVDALYVSPDPDLLSGITEAELNKQSLTGGYREKVGWGKGRAPVASHEYIVELGRKTNF